MAPELILPVSDHFPGRITYRGNGYFASIKAKFEAFNLTQKVKETPFGVFWNASELKFSGVIVHQLLLRKKKVSEAKNDEVWFYVGKTEARFGRSEFGLITGLKMSGGPSSEELTAQCDSDRILRDYLNNSKRVTFKTLWLAFEACDVADDVYKLGLCAFVEGVLLSRAEGVYIWTDMLKLVENEEKFFEYPWGLLSYQKLLSSTTKNMQQLRQNYMDKNDKTKKKHKKDKKVTQPEAKYNVYGYAPALQYWAFEAMQVLGKKYGQCKGTRFPRMLNWSTPDTVTKHDVKQADVAALFEKRMVVLQILYPRNWEVDYWKDNCEGEVPTVEMGLDEVEETQAGAQDSTAFETQAQRVAEYVERSKIIPPSPPKETADASTSATVPPTPATVPPSSTPPNDSDYLLLAKRLEKVEAQQVAILTAQTEMKADFKRSQKEMKNLIMDQIATVISLLQKQPSEPTQPSGPAQQSDPTHPSDPAEPLQTDVEELQGPPDGVEFCRIRRKRKPVFLNDYTAGKKKQRHGPVVVDTLKPADPRLLKFFQKWITYARDNGRPRDVHTGEATRSWFVKLMVLNEWLEDDQIDVMAHLLRRRRTLYLEVYTRKGVVLDTSAPQFFSMFWNMCEGDRSKMKWDESVMSYVQGIPHRYLPCWEKQEYIYFVLHLPKERHWVAVEVDIENWEIIVYDSDIGATVEAAMESYLKPYSELFANLIRDSGYFQYNNYVHPVELGDLSQLLPLHYRRATSEVVPQTNSSGNCGMYAMEHIEHLMLDRSLEHVHDDNMLTFRHRWCVDLFYQNLTW
ncbi:uncharacterized protein LOC115695232 [Cannabis sativa]|uniref:uncharacterized protein LOC115695232 n=1 Tax=Cannabis sativa TaxID=3483 RepID=UPI0029CA2061|nr:uncharacterized protein LOC115695232 [Cannabis sativa]